jgi:hypothetical protein
MCSQPWIWRVACCKFPCIPGARIRQHFYQAEAVTVYSYVLWTLQHSSNIWAQVGICIWGLTYKVCLVYLDDVIVTCQTFEGQLYSLWKVFWRFQWGRLKLNPRTCCVTGKSDHEPREAEGYIERPPPKEIYKLMSVLVLCTYYLMFIAGFTDITRLLTQLA